MLAVLLMNRMTKQRRLNAKKLAKPAKVVKKHVVVECCRTCLGTEDLLSIFHGKETEKKRSEELLLVTGLEIKMNDGLSQKICSKCLEIMTTALKFRRKSKRAEKALINMLTKTSNGLATVTKPIQRPKREKSQDDNVKTEYTYEYNLFGDGEVCGGDDFQNDYDCSNDYETDIKNEDLQPAVQPEIQQKESAPAPKRERMVIPNASSYKCQTCGKEFRMKATYKAHIRFHTNYCVCETCGKRCRNNNQLQEHKRAKHGLGRIHKCAYCEYSSATKEALIIHERRHTGERPYICDHCGANFHRRSNLVQHIAIHLPEKNFQCDLCPKRLKSRKFLQIHKHNAHTGKRYGYLCPVCRRRFEKPNKCTVCPIRAKSRKLLLIHEYKYHRSNKYRYICPICQDTFTRPGNVRQHLVRTHSINREDQGVIERLEIYSELTPQDSRPTFEVPVIF